MHKGNMAFCVVVLMLIVSPVLVQAKSTTSEQLPLNISLSNLGANNVPLLVSSNHNLTVQDIQRLENYGVVTTVAGPTAVIHTKRENVDSLRGLPFLIQVQQSRTLSVDLDQSVPDIGANMVWDELKDAETHNVTGAGVIIGFVDTGIDTTHPDFYFPNGTTKILYVWDQTTQGRPPSGFGYGYECTATDVQSQSCPETDTFGHGTHVAGIAASSGMATGNYTGVAPGASIIFVKSGGPTCNETSWNFGTAQILDGINYIVKKASKLGMRAVINLSLGGNTGAHDGTDPLELGLDSFAEAGIPIVVAAGNSLTDNTHIRGQLLQGGNVSFYIQVRPTTTDLAIDLWYSSSDQFSATLIAPNGETFAYPAHYGSLYLPTDAYNNVTTLASSTTLGRELYAEVNDSTPLPSQNWQVTLKADAVKGNGTWDAWVDTYSCTFPGAFFIPGTGYDIDQQDTIGIPGTAKYVVTVGAYITKNSWKAMNGKTYGSKTYPIGLSAPFSSWGPTRDGRIKPDVVAPGMFIASARSSSVPRETSDPDQYHRILAGTSMATPHVAGVIALMLQYMPTLVATDVPEMVRNSARLDSYTGFQDEATAKWGFGKVDARTATGFFRVTIVANGLPGNIAAPALVDNNRTLQILGNSSTDLYFLKGSEHKVSFNTGLLENGGTRYSQPHHEMTFTNNSIVDLNYQVQYLLTVDSQFAPTNGSGWYNSGANATFGAPELVSATGLLGFFGAEYTLAYWTTDDGKIVYGSVIMDGPKTVTADYLLTYPIQTLLLAITLAAVVAVAAILIVRRRLT